MSIAYTVRDRMGTTTELSLADVDLEEVLYRLALHAQNLFCAAACLGVTEVALPGGEGPEDFASSTLLKLLDPQDASVSWSDRRGSPTTAGLIAYLREVLRRDFIDLKRSKRYKTTVYVDGQDGSNHDSGEPLLIADPLAKSDSPEEAADKRERLEWLLRQFDGEPDLQELVRLQFEPAGYNAFSNQELASRLKTSVHTIENRKKRLKLRLRKLAASRAAEQTKYVKT